MTKVQPIAVRLRRLVCRVVGHPWFRGIEWEPDGTPRNTGKRQCLRCGQEQWLFTKPYPRVGEPATRWRDMAP